ncbi:glycosyl hydrolase [Kineosporia sp. NBRC 101731]|uniref:glycosyl hydrolase n=1 Tax=Kineosporia sp. NBRC 101731 TaxID=3032199 RepID=UPI0024A2496E|nr:glycosyl hydrolase [Kineosporia sp. NBRC 101731]GLY27653.1 hypothetical protein Kisp02_10180 [Kineosporia sp. NBRC 101731]
MRATPSDDAPRPEDSSEGRHAASASHPEPVRASSTVPEGDLPTAPVPTGPTGPTGPSRRLLIGAGTAVAALALVGTIFVATRGSDDGDGSTTPTASASASGTTTSGPKFGVFKQTSADEVAAYEQWLGADVSYVVDFSARETWDNIADPQYLLDEWKDTPYRLVYAVAMLPTDGSGTLRSGANGEYDQYFQTLAQNLVASGQEDAILRVGWEFNLSDWPWASEDSESWKSYYRTIVETMRSVPGANFAFDWNVNNGSNAYDAADYYPGDDVVDYVGVDAYDVSGKAYPYPDTCDSACYVKHQKQAWDESIYGGDRGLKYWSNFAREHGKQLTLPEWGVWQRPDGIGGSDDPDYIQRMYDFITDTDNNVAYASYFEYDYSDGSGGQHSLENSFPNSAAKFKELFLPLYRESASS